MTKYLCLQGRRPLNDALLEGKLPFRTCDSFNEKWAKYMRRPVLFWNMHSIEPCIMRHPNWRGRQYLEKMLIGYATLSTIVECTAQDRADYERAIWTEGANWGHYAGNYKMTFSDPQLFVDPVPFEFRRKISGWDIIEFDLQRPLAEKQ